VQVACSRGPPQPIAPPVLLVRGNAMSATHQAYRHARLERLLDHPNLSQTLSSAVVSRILSFGLGRATKIKIE
jgi:hypothetical protein